MGADAVPARRRILVVDDEVAIADLVRAFLEEEGYEVLLARDGAEGLERARMTSPDLIILDVMMPKLDGFKVARLLKSDKRYQRIPILLFTVRAGDQEAAVRESGADALLQKPFDPQRLKALVADLLGSRPKPGP